MQNQGIISYPKDSSYNDFARSTYYKEMEKPKDVWIKFTSDRTFWSAEYWDLFTGMYCKEFDGELLSVSEAQDLIRGVSASTKVRCYQNAVKSGFLEVVDASDSRVRKQDIKKNTKKVVRLSERMRMHCRLMADKGIDACIEVGNSVRSK